MTGVQTCALPILNTQAVPATAFFSLSHLCKNIFHNTVQAAPVHSPEQHWLTLIEEQLAETTPRLHNLLWHEIRQNWPNYSQAQQASIQSLGWAPTRSAHQTGSGEDFLFYARHMLNAANNRLKPYQLTVAAWSNDQPAPENEDIQSRMERIKSDYKYWGALVRENADLQKTEYLQGMSLHRLGQTLESIFHKMQLRWNKLPAMGTRPQHDISDSWNAPSYNALNDQYSAPLNELFWYLINWIDHRVTDWHEANQEHIILTEHNAIQWYQNTAPFKALVSNTTPWIGGCSATFVHSDKQAQLLQEVFHTIQHNQEHSVPLAS